MGLLDVIKRGAEFGTGFIPGGDIALDILGELGGGDESLAQKCAKKGKVPSSRRPGKCAKPERERARMSGGDMKKRTGRVVDFRHIHAGSGRVHTHFVGDPPDPPGTRVLPIGGVNVGGFAPAGGDCPPLMRRDPITGQCKLFVGDQPGREPGGVGGGQVVMGRYGAAMVPDVDERVVLECLPGMVLGKDNLCYNSSGKNSITNKERKHPKGPRPLGTAGEMKALTKAAAFGRRMEGTVKRMQKIGVLKKPSRGGRRASRPQRAIGPGGPSIINVE